MLKTDEIIEQSKAAYGQWAEQWRDHARQHSHYKMKSFSDFQNIGVGKALLIAANGYTLEENIELVEKYKDNVDILACDKSLGHLLAKGIYPTYCMVCDANVSYEKYLEPYKDMLDKTILFQNVCGNPEWTEKGNWKDRYFFCNKDSIKSELEFGQISGCSNLIPAATNVSGAMVVLATQSDNSGRNNFFGYDLIILLGFDYSWREEKSYYAFDYDGAGKRYYMKHICAWDREGDLCHTSQNLHFSSRWLSDYCRVFNLPVVLGSGHSLLTGIPTADLESSLAYKYKPEDQAKVRSMIKDLSAYRLQAANLESKLRQTGKDHWQNFKEYI